MGAVPSVHVGRQNIFGGEASTSLVLCLLLKANKKWNDKNKDKQRIYRYRSYARKFIRDLADDDDLKELQELIHKRLNN